MVLLADLNQSQFLFSNLKQLIEKQNCQISQLHNQVDRMQIKITMLTETKADIVGKNEMIENEFRMRGIK